MAFRLGCSLLLRRCVASSSSEAVLPQLCAAAQRGQLWSSASTSPANFRSISNSIQSSSSSLVSILAEEIKYERDNYIPDAVITNGPPAPFTLSDDLGDTLLTLTRKYQGEEVVVTCMANEQPVPDENDENNLVQFNVTVNKGDQALVLECISDGTFLQIEHVSAEPKEGLESSTAYTGPVFDELDDNLKGEFTTYLEDRGVDLNLADYLRHLVHDKEQKEYTNWLQKVQKFVQ